MSTIRVKFASTFAGLTDVGYEFFLQNVSQGARSEAGVTDEGDGWYSATGVTLQGDNVRWNSTGTAAAKAREDISDKIKIESMNTTIATNLDDQITDIPGLLLDLTDAIETGLTVRQALRALVSTALGEATGGGTGSIVFENPGGTATRVTLTVDASGNRSAVTLNL